MRSAIRQFPSQVPPEPPAKEAWWHVKISAADFKSKAVYDTGKFLVVVLFTALTGSKVIEAPPAKAAYAALTALGIFLMVRMFWPQKRKGEPSKTLIFTVLQQDCQAILTRYKKLMFDNRQESRLPLSPSSWPNFGQEFDYNHFSLASNSRMFSEFETKMRSLWQDMERRDDLKMFSLGSHSRMDEVVEALEEVDQLLKQLRAGR
jgi:hypothetical protein